MDVRDLTVDSYIEACEGKWRNPSLPFILVCGWARGFHAFIHRIVSEEVKFNVLVLRSSDLMKHEAAQLRRFGEMFAVVRGRAILEVNLLKAGVLEASRHLVFPDDLDNPSVSEEDPTRMDESEVYIRRLQGDRDAVIVNLKIRNLLEHARRVKEKRKASSPIRQRISEPQMFHKTMLQDDDRVALNRTVLRSITTQDSMSPREYSQSSFTMNDSPRAYSVLQRHSSPFINSPHSGDNSRSASLDNNYCPRDSSLQIQSKREEEKKLEEEEMEECTADFPNKVLTEISDIRHVYFLDSFDFQHSAEVEAAPPATADDAYQYSPDFASGRVFSDSLLYRYCINTSLHSCLFNSDPSVNRY